MTWLYPVTIFLLVSLATSFPNFQTKIPNGNNVEHPCQPNVLWPGVGHLNSGGGGDRNPFGLDFYNNGKIWNATICHMDSDGDGRTNGEELGDPGCTWTQGNPFPAPNPGPHATHPGVCEPWGDPACVANNALFAGYIQCTSQPGIPDCDALQNQDVFNITYRMPDTPVPDKETTYMCVVLDLALPNNIPYHMIAYDAVVDNQYVTHHIVAMGCNPGQPVPPQDVGVPHECGIDMSNQCNVLLGVWSLGFAGHCLPDEAGFKVGPGSYTQISIQLHWTNPLLHQLYTDSSGLNIFFTPTLRPNDAGVFLVGQSYLEIPPGETAHNELGFCPSECTNQYFLDTINVFAALNHMHYLGSQMRVEQYRNGNFISHIADDQTYLYDSPYLHEHNPALSVLPNDVIKTTCTYNSIARQGHTTQGQSTFDEMCYGILFFYPVVNVNSFSCVPYKSISSCDISSGNINGCIYNNFHNYWIPENNARKTDILANCPLFGECTYNCLNAQMTYRDDPCMSGDVYDFIISRNLDNSEAVPFHISMLTCDFCYTYYNLTLPQNQAFYDSIVDNCMPLGNCLAQCQAAIDDAKANNPCMRDGIYEHFRSFAVNQNDFSWLVFHAAVASCDNV